MNTHPFRSTLRLSKCAIAGVCCGATLWAALSALPASAQTGNAKVATTQTKNKADKQVRTAGIEPWAGRRVLFLMPLQLGAGWNADKNFGRAILPRAEELLQNELQKTGKFSVVRAHRFSPLIQRGLQEKRLTEDQVKNAIVGEDGKLPTLEGIGTLLGQFIFDSPPMVADFRLEEVRSGGGARPSVQVQVSGRLYQMEGVAPDASLQEFSIKSPITITSDPAIDGRNNIDRFLAAANNGFMQVSSAFVAPIEDIQFAQPTGDGGIKAPTGVGGTKADMDAGGGAVESVPPVPASPGGSAAGAGTGTAGTAAPTGSVTAPATGSSTRGAGAEAGADTDADAEATDSDAASPTVPDATANR